MEHSECSLERKVHSNGLPKKIEKFQINNLTIHLQELVEKQTKPRVEERK